MEQTVEAVFESGVLRPLTEIELEESAHVELTIRKLNGVAATVDTAIKDPLADLRVETGVRDLAENFDDYRFGRRVP